MTKTQLDIEDDRTDEGQSVTESPSFSLYPGCDGQIVQDAEHGETTWEESGIILDEDSINRGSEYLAFHGDVKDEKSRVGVPITLIMHNVGLNTTTSGQVMNASGQPVSGRNRARLHRLRTGDERIRMKDANDRNRYQVPLEGYAESGGYA
jgi:transcription initiation factor TFIIB